MNISSTSFVSQMQQMQRKEPPSAADLTSKVMETSDINGDSLLSIEELGLSEDSFSSLDTNEDGSISSSELQISISSKLDSMKNKSLSPQEFGSFLSELGLEVPPPPPPQGGPDVSKMASEIFSANDSNEDGTLSLSELGISEDLFSTLDSDEDGNITQEELENNLTTLFESVESGEISKDEAGDVLSQLGVAPPPPPPAQGGGGMSGGGDSSSTTYEAADANQDGTVTAAEQAAYDLAQSSSSDDMTDYTMNLVSTLLDALKIESPNNEEEGSLDLSKFKSIMSMVNNETQTLGTAEKLNSYLSNLDVNLKTA